MSGETNVGTCFVREGKCNYCGECCKHIALYMKSPRTRPYCRYARKKDDDTFTCVIREEFERTGKKLNGVPVKHFIYWKEECLPYPAPDDSAHCPPKHVLPSKCGYRMIRVAE